MRVREWEDILKDVVESLFPERGTGGFGVQQPPEDDDDAEEKVKNLATVLETHADAPTTPDALFEDVMDAVDSPAYGPMDFDHYDRPDRLDELRDTFEEAEKLLEAEFDDVVDDSVDRGIH